MAQVGASSHQNLGVTVTSLYPQAGALTVFSNNRYPEYCNHFTDWGKRGREIRLYTHGSELVQSNRDSNPKAVGSWSVPLSPVTYQEQKGSFRDTLYRL